MTTLTQTSSVFHIRPLTSNERNRDYLKDLNVNKMIINAFAEFLKKSPLWPGVDYSNRCLYDQTIIYVAEEKSTKSIVGICIAAKLGNDTVNIGPIAVMPEHQKKRIATDLLTKTMNLAKEQWAVTNFILFTFRSFK